MSGRMGFGRGSHRLLPFPMLHNKTADRFTPRSAVS